MLTPGSWSQWCLQRHVAFWEITLTVGLLPEHCLHSFLYFIHTGTEAERGREGGGREGRREGGMVEKGTEVGREMENQC